VRGGWTKGPGPLIGALDSRDCHGDTAHATRRSLPFPIWQGQWPRHGGSWAALVGDEGRRDVGGVRVGPALLDRACLSHPKISKFLI
jgi:hypothetical protein